MAAKHLLSLWHNENKRTVSSWHLYSCPRYICHIFKEYIHLKKLNCWYFNKGPPTGLRQFANDETRLGSPSPCIMLSGLHTFILSPGLECCMCRWLAVTVATQCWCLPEMDIWIHETGKGSLGLCSKPTTLHHYKSSCLNSVKMVKCFY